MHGNNHHALTSRNNLDALITDLIFYWKLSNSHTRLDQATNQQSCMAQLTNLCMSRLCLTGQNRNQRSTTITGDTTGVEEEEHRRIAGAQTPPARTGLSIIHHEHEFILLSDYTGVEWVLYPRALTCQTSPTRHSTRAPRAPARARAPCLPTITMAVSRARRGPPLDPR